MMSRIQRGMASLAALAAPLTALVVLATAAAPAPAQAEMIAFWEDDKPNITGSERRSGSRKRLPAAVTSDDEDAPAARSRKTRRAARNVEREEAAPSPRKSRKVRVASLGKDDGYDPRPSRKSLSGGGNVTWAASSSCLNGTLTSIVRDVASQYGAVTVSSTCRSHGHNAAVGGAKKSQHLTGDAVDFRVHGNASGAMAYLRNHGSVGGFHHYGGGLFHIDTGPKRTW